MLAFMNMLMFINMFTRVYIYKKKFINMSIKMFIDMFIFGLHTSSV